MSFDLGNRNVSFLSTRYEAVILFENRICNQNIKTKCMHATAVFACDQVVAGSLFDVA